MIMGEEERIDEGTTYSPRKVVVPAMLAIALTVFLIALVRHVLPLGRVRCAETLL